MNVLHPTIDLISCCSAKCRTSSFVHQPLLPSQASDTSDLITKVLAGTQLDQHDNNNDVSDITAIPGKTGLQVTARIGQYQIKIAHRKFVSIKLTVRLHSQLE